MVRATNRRRVLAALGALGVATVADLIALLKNDANRRTFASSGAGTSTHLAGELFADLIGVSLRHVPYKGTPVPVVQRLNAEIVKILKGQEGDKLAKQFGMEIIASTPAELAAHMGREIPRWSRSPARPPTDARGHAPPS